MAVTERLARGGRKPWALGGSDSFTLTDWFENVYIRTQGQWNVLVRTAARQVTTAQVVRFDGSDLVPDPLPEELGRTLQHVIRRPAAAPQLMKEFHRKAARAFNR